MSLIHLLRLVAFGIVLLFSIIVLGLSANLDALAHGHSNFASLSLAVSIITLFTLVPIVVIEKIRKGVFTSLVFVELIWVGLLWVLWLASGADAASLGVDPSLCSSSVVFNSGEMTVCSSIVAITAFSFLNWLILKGWFITLLVFSIIGNHWNNSVPDTDITKRSVAVTGTPVPVVHYQPNMTATPGATPYSPYPPSQPSQGTPYAQPGQQGHTPGTVPV